MSFLDSPAQQLSALARVRARTDGREVPVWWEGDVFSSAPGEPYRRLFGFEGINVGRLVEVEGGYELLTREAAFYLDPGSRNILRQWENPVTGEQVDVQHVWNDPVNQRWLLDGPRGPFSLPTTVLGGKVCLHLEIPLAYPSPLPVAEYPDNSADDTYRALELFQFFTSADALADTDRASADCEFSWARMSPWLPWMRMGARPGGLVFHCRGRKLDDYSQVPEHVRAFIAEHHPEFAGAPESWSEPNETSWTYFRKQVSAG